MALTFRTLSRNDSDDWVIDDSLNLLSESKLTVIRDALENRGSVVIEHWIYRGGQAPTRQVFDDYDEFLEYLQNNAYAGDIVDIWSLHDLICKENRLASGKCPANDGKVPHGGSY